MDINLLAYIKYMATKVTKNASIISGLVILIATGTYIYYYNPPELESNIKPEELEIVIKLRNDQLKIKNIYQNVGSIENLFDLIDTEIIKNANSTTTMKDFVCIENPSKVEDSCQYRTIRYSPIEYKDRVTNLLKKANPNLIIP